MILKYEKVITSNQMMIRDLQGRVYEYLGDAFEKEKEA